MFRRALLGLLSVTAAGTLTFALAGSAMAAPPATHCDPPGLHVAIDNATDQQAADQALLNAANKAVTDAQAALAAAQATNDPVKIAAAQADLDQANAALAALQTQITSDTDLITHLTAVQTSIRGHANCAAQTA